MSPRPSIEVETDADLLRPLREPPREIVDALGDVALHRVSVAQVSSRFSDFSSLRDVTVGGLLASDLLLTHAEVEDKDGAGLIYADLQGRRKDVAAVSVCALGRDVDGWLPFDQEYQRRERTGFVGITYTTHSHGKMHDQIGCEPAYAWRKGVHGAVPFTDAQLTSYLKHDGKGYLANVHVLHDGQPVEVKGKGYCLEFTHDPVPKLRCIEFLSEPIPLDEVGQDGWRAIYRMMSDADYGDGVYDPTCVNPARIHYCPAHKPDASWELEIHGGRLRPWRDVWERIQADVLVKRDKARPAAMAALNDAPADLKEIAHYLGYISPSVGRKQWVSCICAIARETKGSPEGRSLAHSWSAGDAAKYNPDDLDGVWDWCDPNSQDGATMGTLVFLAKQADGYTKYRRGARKFNFGSLSK